MKIKIVANFLQDGKRTELVEEIHQLIDDPPTRKDTTRLSNLIKKWFEDGLNRTVIVKLRISDDGLVAKVNIRPGPGEK